MEESSKMWWKDISKHLRKPMFVVASFEAREARPTAISEVEYKTEVFLRFFFGVFFCINYNFKEFPYTV